MLRRDDMENYKRGMADEAVPLCGLNKGPELM